MQWKLLSRNIKNGSVRKVETDADFESLVSSEPHTGRLEDSSG